MFPIEIIAVLVIGYLFGSVSFAVIIAKSKGVDIFAEGSGNPGATNVKRVLGKGPGNLCFALDALKGFVAAGWPQMQSMGVQSDPEILSILGLAAAILGHSFSVFIKFKGGKGVATTMGGLLAMMPLVLFSGLGVWLMAFYTSRYVSLASILFGLSMPLLAFLFGMSGSYIAFSCLIALLILVRHKANIKRLLNGTENRFLRNS
ncbi:MAG: glycerol-3-phosphate 1-O-acyltransferase PlsY [Opitutales bacterium]|nr:glycerol-3-phosphate 1-O-acyltransferase PlsY [Opitutales bacterium]NRA28388.1 glycerol-3-phosphate 1-O-acyltransferase PlsY [Opitutales bacterium]